MRLLRVRLIVPLILGIALVSLLSSWYEVHMALRGLRSDLDRRSVVLGDSLVGNVERALDRGSDRDLENIALRFGNREHLAGIAICDAGGSFLAITPILRPRFLTCPPSVVRAMAGNRAQGIFLDSGGSYLHIYALPVHRENGEVAGGMAIVDDAGYIRDEGWRMWRQIFLRVLLEALLIVLATLLIVRWSITGPIANAAQWMRGLRTGRISPRQEVPDYDFFRPLAQEVTTFAESLKQARVAAETEARLREQGESLWTPERLAVHVRSRLGGSRLFVVANREPYMHLRQGKAVETIVPASGLVTALEPVLRTCDGTWVAHGAGDADMEMVDPHGRLRVPPDDPRYTLRRVWLTKEEEEGYYYGFANEGLWPLCHIAHTRPLFRSSDWEHYQRVNRKFAEAVLEEMQDTEAPVLLAQDYHFALLPRLVKQQRPEVRVAIFWHIPWPNPEVFGICPMQRELLDGLLGADLIGFHIQSHCNNFMQTVDRALESRADWEHFSVRRRDHLTLVRPFPISVEFQEEKPIPDPTSRPPDVASVERNALLKELGVDTLFLGVGVDRVDYTKGILERLLAVERFLERYPSYQGKFTFVQVGAPSRTHIKRYHDLFAEVESEAERINWRFQGERWKPIVFLKRQHSHEELRHFYRAADVCLVTSLHDGMNLVAKEFLAARDDEEGMLVLSRFTGAAHELRDAILVNPYDINQMSQAIHFALEMDSADRRARMRHLREVVKENNVYRWAGNLMADLCGVRLDVPQELEASAGSKASVA
ncbi:MAG TPA: trehalose-6-phosphate synthase [Terriglobales bacterium]|nr:trehalose-6-phosphate synthase [Terriglobales bacterium]